MTEKFNDSLRSVLCSIGKDFSAVARPGGTTLREVVLYGNGVTCGVGIDRLVELATEGEEERRGVSQESLERLERLVIQHSSWFGANMDDDPLQKIAEKLEALAGEAELRQLQDEFFREYSFILQHTEPINSLPYHTFAPDSHLADDWRRIAELMGLAKSVPAKSAEERALDLLEEILHLPLPSTPLKVRLTEVLQDAGRLKE